MLYPLEYVFPIIPLLPLSMAGSEQLLLAPTPYIIGVPATFLAAKRNVRLPDDVWLVDLDTPVIRPPEVLASTASDVPNLPDADAKVLRSHLKQVLGSTSFQPIKNFDELPAESLSRLKEQQMDLESPGPTPAGSSAVVYPFLFGNDVDSVDVATRVAMVKFFNSSNLLANFPMYLRTLRLYPRPIVTVQTQPLLKSRTKPSAFMLAFSETQAVECFAEWTLMPTNTAYLRVQGGVFDPTLIGDKPKWYAHNLTSIEHSLWPETNKICSILRSFQVTIIIHGFFATFFQIALILIFLLAESKTRRACYRRERQRQRQRLPDVHIFLLLLLQRRPRRGA